MNERRGLEHSERKKMATHAVGVFFFSLTKRNGG
jgi:hypothetical protein